MPRKPFKNQRGYDITTHGRNFMLSDCIRDIKTVSDWEKRYFVGETVGVIRLPGYSPLIHNGRKAP